MQHKMPEEKKRVRRLFTISPVTDRQLNELGEYFKIDGKIMPRSRVIDMAIDVLYAHYGKQTL